MRYFRVFFVLCCFVPSTSVLVADNPTAIHLSPSNNWFEVLNGTGLNPGDEVVLSEGVYNQNSRLSFRHFGTAENPIVIRAAEGANVEIRRPNAGQNVIDVEGAQYVTFRGLKITGGSAGIRIRRQPGTTSGRHPIGLTFEDLTLDNLQNGGITANENGTTYEGLIFRRNEVSDIGGLAGFYLGCNNISGGATGCVFRNGLVEDNYIHDLGGGVGDGIQIKDGSYNNIIRDNVVLNTGGGGSVGIFVYGADGNNNARNIIEGNVIWNSGDNAIQAAAEVTIRNNIIFSAGDGFSGISIQRNQSNTPGNVTIVNNTVFSTGGDNVLSVNHYGQTYSGPVVVANNALYATEDGRAITITGNGDRTVVGNVGVGDHLPSFLGDDLPAWDPTGNLLADFESFASMNAFPIAGSDLIGEGDATYQPDVDFNGVSRSGTNDVGAYVYDSNGNPGWVITSAFKEFLELLDGDFDNDNDVDGADFLAWQRDGLNATDLDAWEANFGTTGLPVTASTSVPEPSTGVIIFVCCGVCAMRRRATARRTAKSIFQQIKKVATESTEDTERQKQRGLGALCVLCG